MLSSPLFFFFSFFFFVFLPFLGPLPTAHGGSQARGPIGAVDANLHHSTAMQDLSRICNLHHSSRQRWILNPLSKAMD